MMNASPGEPRIMTKERQNTKERYIDHKRQRKCIYVSAEDVSALFQSDLLVIVW
jgi:hypothetical protein